MSKLLQEITCQIHGISQPAMIDWLSIIAPIALTIVAIVISIRVSIKQNKLALFDRRLKNYIIIESLISLYKKNKLHYKKNDEVRMAVDYDFHQLTNNSYLEKIGPAIKETLEDPHHKNFLRKLEELQTVSTEAKFIYYGKTADLISEFVLSYKDLLFKMYQHQISFENCRFDNFSNLVSMEILIENMNECGVVEALNKSIDNLNNVYDKLEKYKVEEKIAHLLKL